MSFKLLFVSLFYIICNSQDVSFELLNITLPYPMYAFGASLYNDQLITINGYGNIDGDSLTTYQIQSSWIFNLSSNTNSFIEVDIINTMPGTFARIYSNAVFNELIIHVPYSYYIERDFKNGDSLWIYNITNRTYNDINKYNDKLPVETSSGCVIGSIKYNSIYVIGGGVSTPWAIDTLQIYDMINDSWTTYYSSLNEARNQFACTLNSEPGYEQYIYIFGGQNITGYQTTSIERYNILQNKWVMLPVHLEVARSSHACVYTDVNDYIYCTGGLKRGAFSSLVLSSVEIFDCNTEEMIPNQIYLANAVSGHQMVKTGFHIYVLGGSDDNLPPDMTDTVQILVLSPPTTTINASPSIDLLFFYYVLWLVMFFR